MKKQLQKRLARLGMVLIGARFGILGDWIVEGSDGSQAVFATLGHVRRMLEDLENTKA